MRTGGHGLLVAMLIGGLLYSASACAQNRFDVQIFIPAPGPRDLLIVPQTQPLSHLSVSVGGYLSFALNPLALINLSGSVTNVVKNRLTLDLMAALGLYDWLEVGLVAPVILFQQGDNLQPIGQEGSVSAQAFGDVSLLLKAPILKRLSYASGIGLGLGMRVDFPTGSQSNFAGNGQYTYNPTILADYRFKGGALVAAQLGVNFRKGDVFLSNNINPITKMMMGSNIWLGSVITAGLGGEIPIVRRWGLTTIGGVYANIPIPKSADDLALLRSTDTLKNIPAEALLGLRWYADFGVTFTTGINFGCDCGFGLPAFSFFIAAVWTPYKTREYEAIKNFKKPPDDPDGDGVIGSADRCPTVWGPPENNGCPIRDTDKDGIPDHLDDCPFIPGLAIYHGCPRVYANQNKIKVLEKVHFPTDQDIILPESFSVLEEVADLIKVHPEWLEILVEGHCDSRADDAYNLDLSQRRALSVRRFLVDHGIEPSRLRAEGFGRSRPIATNRTEEGMALNRRVEFTILRFAPVAPHAPMSPKAKSIGGK